MDTHGRPSVEWFVEDLQRRGVEWVSTLCGHGLDPFFHAARQAGLTLVDLRNEQSAAYVADAWGRLRRTPGVCAVSSGVAVANAMAGVLNAHMDGSPMLLLSGSADITTLGRGAFQDLDQVDLVRPVTKHSRLIDHPSRILHLLDEAWTAATAGPPGPVHLMFPMDVQKAAVTRYELVHAHRTQGQPGPAPDVAPIARALAASKRPLLIAGSGVYYSGQGKALLGFAGEFQIPVQTPIWDRGIADRDHASFAGVVGAASGGPKLLAESDCVVLAGAISDYRLGYLEGIAGVHRQDSGWDKIASAYRLAGGAPHTEWMGQVRRQQGEFAAALESRAASQMRGDRLHSRQVVQVLEETLSEDAVLIIDGGSVGQWAHQLLSQRRYPGHWLTCGRSGVVGYGLAGAMAARLAYPDRAVVLLSGDGAFTFNVAELECAARQRLSFVAIVADDQSWGITQSGHIRQFGQPISTQLGPIRFDLLAESLGATGVKVESVDALRTELGSAIRSGAVTVLHVPIAGGNPS